MLFLLPILLFVLTPVEPARSLVPHKIICYFEGGDDREVGVHVFISVLSNGIWHTANGVTDNQGIFQDAVTPEDAVAEYWTFGIWATAEELFEPFGDFDWTNECDYPTRTTNLRVQFQN